jgi:hypothetical protein
VPKKKAIPASTPLTISSKKRSEPMNLPLSRFIAIRESEERLETMRGPYLLETRLRLVKLSLYRALPTMGRPGWQIGKWNLPTIFPERVRGLSWS